MTAAVVEASTLGGDPLSALQLFPRDSCYYYSQSTPAAVIIAPKSVSTCSGFTLDSCSSYGTITGRTWGIKLAPDSTSLSTVQSKLATAPASSCTIHFAPGEVSAGTYTFTLVVADSNGASSSTAATVKLTSSNVPMLVLDGPKSVTAYAWQDIWLNVRMEDTDDTLCTTYNITRYIWGSTHLQALSQNYLQSSVLRIPAYSFPSGTKEEIFVKAYLTDFSGTQSSFSLSVLQGSPLVALIDGGNHTHTISRQLKLDASLSYDPDNRTAALQFKWSCTCTSSTCSFSSSLNPSAITVLSSNTLQAGEDYIFCVTVSQDTRSSSSCITIYAVSELTPEVLISPLGPRQNSQNIIRLNSYFCARPEFDLCDLSGATFIWEVVTGSFDMEENKDYLLTSPTSQNLVLAAGALAPGSIYRFRLTATNNSSTGFSEVDVAISSAPTGGNLAVSKYSTPTISSMLLAAYSIVCTGWTSDNFPLRYSFGIFSDQWTHEISLGLFHTSALVDVRLPVGNITVTSHAFDFYGNEASTSQEIEVVAESGSKIAQLLNVTFPRLLDEADYAHDVGLVVQLIYASDYYLEQYGDLFSISTQLFRSFERLINYVSMSEPLSLSTLASASAVLSKRCSSKFDLQRLLRVISQIVAGGLNSNEGISADTAQDLLEACEGVLARMSDKASLRSDYFLNKTLHLLQEINFAAAKGFSCGESLRLKTSTLFLDLRKDLVHKLSVARFQTGGASISVEFPESFISSDECFVVSSLLLDSAVLNWSSLPMQSASQPLFFNVFDTGNIYSFPHIGVTFSLPLLASFTGEKDLVCSFFYENKWEQMGCRTVSISQQNVSCWCNHTSTFQVLFSPNIVSSEGKESGFNATTIVVMLVGTAIFLLLMATGLAADKVALRRRKKRLMLAVSTDDSRKATTTKFCLWRQHTISQDLQNATPPTASPQISPRETTTITQHIPQNCASGSATRKFRKQKVMKLLHPVVLFLREHSWFSATLLHSTLDNFSRPQRVLTVFCCLMMGTAICALLIKYCSMNPVVCGIISGIMVMPVAILCMALFKLTQRIKGPHFHNRVTAEVNVYCTRSARTTAALSARWLPFWTAFVLYIILLVLSVLSFVTNAVVGVSYHHEEAEDWLLACLFVCICDFVLVETICSVVALGFISVLLLRAKRRTAIKCEEDGKAEEMPTLSGEEAIKRLGPASKSTSNIIHPDISVDVLPLQQPQNRGDCKQEAGEGAEEWASDGASDTERPDDQDSVSGGEGATLEVPQQRGGRRRRHKNNTKQKQLPPVRDLRSVKANDANLWLPPSPVVVEKCAKTT